VAGQCDAEYGLQYAVACRKGQLHIVCEHHGADFIALHSPSDGVIRSDETRFTFISKRAAIKVLYEKKPLGL